MALSQKHRSSIYQQLSPILGEEEAEALLSQFPARDLDEPVTKEFVRAELAELRADLVGEIGSLRAETVSEIGSLRAEMRGEIGSLRAEMGGLRAETVTEIGSLRTEMRGEIGSLRAEMLGEIGNLRAEMLGEIGSLRAETVSEIGSLRAEIGGLRAELHEKLREQTVWMAGSLTVGMGIAAGIATLFG